MEGNFDLRKYVLETFNYDPLTGLLTLKKTRLGNIKAGAEVGGLHPRGYRQMNILYQRHMVHRIIWLYVHGTLPAHDIDHINGIKDDNRIANLRAVTRSENMQNRQGPQKNNKFGLIGVNEYRPGMFRAVIVINRKQTHLGSFTTPEEAHAVYMEAKRKRHPFNTL